VACNKRKKLTIEQKLYLTVLHRIDLCHSGDDDMVLTADGGVATFWYSVGTGGARAVGENDYRYTS